MKYTKQFKIGLLASIALIILYSGITFLKGSSILSKNNTYYSQYNKTLGLKQGSNIKIKGIKVGKVKEIKLLQTDKGYHILVTLEINKKIKISKNTKAIIKSTILEPTYIQLKETNKKETNKKEIFKNKQTIPGEIEKQAFQSIVKKSDPIIEKLDKILNQISIFTNNLINREDNINTIINNLNKITTLTVKIVESNKKFLAQGGHIDKILQSLSHPKSGIPAITKNINNITNQLEQSNISKLVTNLEQISSAIQNKKGSISKLLYEEELHQNINKNLNSLNQLIKNIYQKPKRYLHFSIFSPKTKSKKTQT